MSGHPKIVDGDGNEIVLRPTDYFFHIDGRGRELRFATVTFDGDLMLHGARGLSSPARSRPEDPPTAPLPPQ